MDTSEILSLNYSWTKICEILGVSLALCRRFKRGKDWHKWLHNTHIQWGRQHKVNQTTFSYWWTRLSDDKSHLLRLGIEVWRRVLYDSIIELVMKTQLLISLNLSNVQCTKLECPYSMWHMDSHHKLIRWRFVTHAAVDGILCIISMNWQPQVKLLQQFMSGVELPMIMVETTWRYMLQAYNLSTYHR